MTEQYTAAVLDADACLDKLKQAKGDVQITLTPSASAEGPYCVCCCGCSRCDSARLNAAGNLRS